MPNTPPKNVFTVDFSGLELNKEQHAGIEAAIRKAALSELAKLPAAPKVGGLGGFVFPKNPLPGIWVAHLDQIAVKEFNELGHH